MRLHSLPKRASATQRSLGQRPRRTTVRTHPACRIFRGLLARCAASREAHRHRRQPAVAHAQEREGRGRRRRRARGGERRHLVPRAQGRYACVLLRPARLRPCSRCGGAAGCTTQACGFRDSYPDFTGLGYDVYCLSADSPTAQSKWQTKVRRAPASAARALTDTLRDTRRSCRTRCSRTRSAC